MGIDGCHAGRRSARRGIVMAAVLASMLGGCVSAPRLTAEDRKQDIEYLAQWAIRLPRSGMIFRVEADLQVTPEGSFNELTGTEPEVKLPPADMPRLITKEDLLQDPRIQKVITDMPAIDG